MSQDLDLNQIGVIEGADKSSSVGNSWDFLRHYEQWMAPWRDKEINLIEIGVATGRSMKIWKRYFSKATIIGADIRPKTRQYAEERVKIEVGSQDDPMFLHRLCEQYPPTIIVDDGSHLAHHIVYTFEQMFPRLLPGGLYVVEDLDLHFGESAPLYRPVEGYDAPGYFLDLARSCMTRHGRQELWGVRDHIVRHTDSVEFIMSGVGVRKKSESPAPFDLPAARAYIAERSLGPTGLMHYAKYMLENGCDIDELIREIVAAGADPANTNVEYYTSLAELFRVRRRMDDALATLASGAERYPGSSEMLFRYGHWLMNAERFQPALAALGRAAGLCDHKLTEQKIVAMLVACARRSREFDAAAEALRAAAGMAQDAECRQVITDGAAALRS
jgi:hypothetical protein